MRSLPRYNLGHPFFTQAKQTPATRCSNEPRRETLLNADGLSGVVLHHPPTATKVVGDDPRRTGRPPRRVPLARFLFFVFCFLILFCHHRRCPVRRRERRANRRRTRRSQPVASSLHGKRRVNTKSTRPPTVVQTGAPRRPAPDARLLAEGGGGGGVLDLDVEAGAAATAEGAAAAACARLRRNRDRWRDRRRDRRDHGAAGGAVLGGGGGGGLEAELELGGLLGLRSRSRSLDRRRPRENSLTSSDLAASVMEAKAEESTSLAVAPLAMAARGQPLQPWRPRSPRWRSRCRALVGARLGVVALLGGVELVAGLSSRPPAPPRWGPSWLRWSDTDSKSASGFKCGVRGFGEGTRAAGRTFARGWSTEN